MNPEEFALDLRHCIAPPNHVAVNSGGTVVAPLASTVCGVGACFSPPFAARDMELRLAFEVEGHPVGDTGSRGKGDCGVLYAGGTWRPEGIERQGTYHFRVRRRLVSLQVTSLLTPCFGRAGYVLRVRLRNRSGASAFVKVRAEVNPGGPSRVPLENWTFAIPPVGRPANRTGPASWSNDGVAIHLLAPRDTASLDAGSEAILRFGVMLASPGDPPPDADDLAAFEEEARAAWRRRIEGAARRVPSLRSDIAGLPEYYGRSLASGLVCLWERPDFFMQPFLATSGMDGGGVCTYPWDTGGYIPHTATMLLGERTWDLVEAFDRMGLDRFNQVTPDGKGFGRWYSYNAWSFVSLAWAAACHLGMIPRVFERVRDVFGKAEQCAPRKGSLMDLGRQLNLLEMRSCGWEHFTASPNAERAWCMDRLADMATLMRQPGAQAWRDEGAAIRAAIGRELWNPSAGWFDCLHDDGHRETVYSIQAFDALRAGACTPAMEVALLSHLREGAFLGRYGVSSVSAEDVVHYELNDPDWSGGGAYTGEAPQLALTLWERGRDALAWDVLQRVFWMGRMLPYFPQEHYCDRPGLPAHKRANVCSGMAGVEAILFGLAGFNPHLDGSLELHPHPPPEGNLAIHGFMYRGRTVDLEMSSRQCRVRVDGEEKYSGPPRLIHVVPAHA